MRYIIRTIAAVCISFNASAASVFYSPSDATNANAKGYSVNHKTFLAVSVGGEKQDDKNLKPTHEFQKARMNLRSLVEIEDDEHMHKAVLDIRAGTDAKEDRDSMVYLQQGYLELQNAQSQPLRAKIAFGLQNTASNGLAVNSSTTMKNFQGIGGQWYRFASMPVINQGGGYNPTFILQNSSLIAQGFGDATFLHSQNNGTLNYVQPNANWSTTNVGIGFTLQRIAGFKAAFTYQPFGNSGNFNGSRGNEGYDRRGITVNAGSGMFMKNITSFALNYLNEWRGVSLNTTLSAETAGFDRNSSIASIERNNIKQYTAGLNLSYVGFTLGGSYSYSGKSLLLKQNAGQVNSYATTNAQNAQVSSISTLAELQSAGNAGLLNYKNSYNYDVGLSYAFARHQIGIAHNRSRFMNNEANATVVSLSEDLKSVNGIKLTTVFEGGIYRFNSASYFKESNSNVSIETPGKAKGYFGYVSLIASI